MAGEKVEEKKEEGEKKEEKEQVKQKVELDPEQYNALLDSVAELEALKAVKKPKEEEEDDLESLAREGKKGKVKEKEVEEEQVDLDNLTNTQLVNVILKEIDKRNEDRLNPLEVTVETLRMLRDIDKAEGKHEDFWKYGDKIQKMCVNDPNLSVEDAYILAKEKNKPAKGEKEGDDKEVQTTRTERLLKLPPRVHGEKPGMAASSTKESSKGLSTRTAAVKAWDEVVGKGKIQIE